MQISTTKTEHRAYVLSAASARAREAAQSIEDLQLQETSLRSGWETCKAAHLNLVMVNRAVRAQLREETSLAKSKKTIEDSTVDSQGRQPPCRKHAPCLPFVPPTVDRTLNKLSSKRLRFAVRAIVHAHACSGTITVRQVQPSSIV